MRRIAVVAVMLAGSAPVARAQLEAPMSPEIRADVITRSSWTSLQLGAGVQVPMGYYVRLGLDGGAGVDVGRSSSLRSARADFLARFLFDPFRQQRWGVSAGAGVSLLARQGDRVRPLLLAALDVEGPRSANGMEPAFQLGLGGGIRLGVILRWGGARTR